MNTLRLAGRICQRSSPAAPQALLALGFRSFTSSTLTRSVENLPNYATQPYVPLNIRNAPKARGRRVEPQSVEELVKFAPKVVTPETMRPLLEAPRLYARIHIYNSPYLVTEGDTIKLSVNLRGANVGDVLNFDQVSEIGSSQYTVSGERIDPSVFSVKGIVIEKSRVKRRIKIIKKRRTRHATHKVSNPALTVLRVTEIKVREPAKSTEAV